MQADGDGVGEVHRGVGLAGVQPQDSPGLEQLTIAEPPVFPAKHQCGWSIWGVAPLQPGQGLSRAA